MLKGLLHVGPLGIILGGNSFEGSGSVQSIRGPDLPCPLDVLYGHLSLALVPALTAFIDARHRRVCAPAPDKSSCLDITPTLLATGHVERLQVRLKPVVSVFGRRQLSQRPLEISLRRRIDRQFNEESRNRIVYGDEEAVSRTGSFKGQPWRESERIEQPVRGRDVL